MKSKHTISSNYLKRNLSQLHIFGNRVQITKTSQLWQFNPADGLNFINLSNSAM